MSKPSLSPCNMAQSASSVTFSLYLLKTKNWIVMGNYLGVLMSSNVCLSEGLTDLFNRAGNFPVDFDISEPTDLRQRVG